ncbi:hypothetical protein [Maribacter sp. 2-571]|uniref:hypothetical protein n=1 Tax=Maribacter sp. 2-571 TaxID=3417569 RepID=UPI003D32910E
MTQKPSFSVPNKNSRRVQHLFDLSQFQNWQPNKGQHDIFIGYQKSKKRVPEQPNKTNWERKKKAKKDKSRSV